MFVYYYFNYCKIIHEEKCHFKIQFIFEIKFRSKCKVITPAESHGIYVHCVG